jgi:hypothetical protein
MSDVIVDRELDASASDTSTDGASVTAEYLEAEILPFLFDTSVQSSAREVALDLVLGLSGSETGIHLIGSSEKLLPALVNLSKDVNVEVQQSEFY